MGLFADLVIILILIDVPDTMPDISRALMCFALCRHDAAGKIEANISYENRNAIKHLAWTSEMRNLI